MSLEFYRSVMFFRAFTHLWWYTYWLLPASECQCFGPLNQAGKSHRSVGGDRRSVIIRDPTFFSKNKNGYVLLVIRHLKSFYCDLNGKLEMEKHTSALSSPLQVASPDWANLYSASFVVSSAAGKKRWKMSSFFYCVLWMCQWHLCWRINYHLIKFSRKQNNDNVLRSIQHDDETPNRPDIVSFHPSKLLNRSILPL